jgi:hypothetical protein
MANALLWLLRPISSTKLPKLSSWVRILHFGNPCDLENQVLGAYQPVLQAGRGPIVDGIYNVKFKKSGGLTQFVSSLQEQEYPTNFRPTVLYRTTKP